jgi:four helix bundle protein
MKLSRFEDLQCWQEARALTCMLYQVIGENGHFRRDIRLAGQLQAATGSIMANIAEGFTRRSDKEFVQFLYTAMASAAEVQSHLYIARDAGYLSEEKFKTMYGQADKSSKLISGLIKYLRSSKTRKTELSRQTEKAT